MQKHVQYKERQCGDHVYQVAKFGSERSFIIGAKVAKALGAGAAAIAETGSENAAIGGILSALSPGELWSMVKDFASVSRVVLEVQSQAGITLIPQPLLPMLDTHFVDRLDELIEFAAFAASVNFGKSMLRGKDLGLRLKAIVSPFLSQPTSTGSSSESSQEDAIT